MRIAQEEIFGPTTALIPVKSFDEAMRVTNGIRYGLSTAIFTARRQQGLPRDARPPVRDHLHQRRHDRRRGAPAVRRHEGHRQRPPRGRPGGARRLHGVEVDLRRLLRQAPARPDRQRRAPAERRKGASCSRTAARAATPVRPPTATSSRPRTAPCSRPTARRSASRRTTSPSTAR